MIEGLHFQNAYVTRDALGAMEKLKAGMAVRQEAFLQSAIEVSTPAGRGVIDCKLGFLWVEDLQYELIEPVSGAVDLYRDALPAGDGLAFHHACMRVDDWADFRARVARQPLPVVLEGGSGPLNFLYLDARPMLGHYLEYIAMPDAVWSGMGGR
jgi:hypothetical protein